MLCRQQMMIITLMLAPRLGSSLQWHDDRWSMGPTGVGDAHKLLETSGSNPCSENIPEGPHRNFSAGAAGQPVSCSIYQQYGGHSIPPNWQIRPETYGCGSVQGHHSDSRIHTGSGECADAKSRSMQDRTGLHTKIFQEINQKWGPLEVASRLTIQLPC